MKIFTSFLAMFLVFLLSSCSLTGGSITPSNLDPEGTEAFSFEEIRDYVQEWGGGRMDEFVNTEKQIVDTHEKAIELAELEMPSYFERNEEVAVAFDRKNQIWSIRSYPTSPYIDDDGQSWIVMDGGATVYITTDGITKLITQDG